MARITSYADLQTAIATWLAATGDMEVTNNADAYIQGAEQRINFGAGGQYPSPALRLQAMETVNPAFSVTAEYTNLPADFLELRRLTLPTNPPQLVPIVSEEQIIALFGGMTGTNYTAAVVGRQLQIRPVLTAPQLFEIVYVAQVPALSTLAPTNWLLTNAPMIYLYAALLEANPTGVDAPEKLATWYAAYNSAATGLQESDRRSRWAGSALQARVAGPTP